MTNKSNAKKTMLPHSEAKVEFYRRYLARYLRILVNAPTITEINIFDVFCGTGIYENGKKGSPIVAIDTINDLGDQKPIDKGLNLIVNDGKATSIRSVSDYISKNNKGYCSTEFYNKSAEDMFDQILSRLKRQHSGVRNLVFVDPYGYKEIKREILERLLDGRTEVILFLPISQMSRFTPHALATDDTPYVPLKNFVLSFFPPNHPLREQVSDLEYIDHVKDALKFDGKYYSTSYYIERDQGTYYALFFMTSHPYGFEKILDVKWHLDSEDGRGFRQPASTPVMPLLAELEKQLVKDENYSKLENLLEFALESPKNNREIYEIILNNEFLPGHCTEVFKHWQTSRPNFSIRDSVTNKPNRHFYVNWDNYKLNTPKVVFSL